MNRRSFVTRGLSFLVAALTPNLLGSRPAAAASVTFADSFDRPATKRGWGKSWHNQRYKNAWGISKKKAYYALPAPQSGAGSYNPNPVFVLDSDVASPDVRATMSSSNPSARFGLIARATGYSEFYSAYVEGGRLRIGRFAPNREVKLPVGAPRSKDLGFKIVSGRRYWMRFKVVGSNPVSLRAKVWPAGHAEPKRWTLSITDQDRHRIKDSTRRPTGVLFMHDAAMRKKTQFKIDRFEVSTKETARPTSPRHTFAFAGRTERSNGSIRTRVVAKTDVPADIKFHVGTDPKLASYEAVSPSETFTKVGTAHAWLDGLSAGATYYWRAVASTKRSKRRTPIRKLVIPPSSGGDLTFAFGSCTHLFPRSRSFGAAATLDPLFFCHLGDLGYPDGVEQAALAARADCYQDRWIRMLDRRAVEALHVKSAWLGLQDDHDYGANNAWRDTVKSFTIDAFAQLSANGSDRGHFDSRLGDVHGFFLDVHRYSDDPRASDGPGHSMLGNTQKQWLMDEMSASNAPLKVVFAPMPFWGPGAGLTSWKNAFATEREQLIGFFARLQGSSKRVILCTGNAHSQFIAVHPAPGGGKPIIEHCSSGTDRIDSTRKTALPNDPAGLIDPQRAVRLVDAFGVVALHGSNGNRKVTLRAVASKTGSDVWPALTIDL